jgi:hypothetical protein
LSAVRLIDRTLLRLGHAPPFPAPVPITHATCQPHHLISTSVDRTTVILLKSPRERSPCFSSPPANLLSSPPIQRHSSYLVSVREIHTFHRFRYRHTLYRIRGTSYDYPIDISPSPPAVEYAAPSGQRFPSALVVIVRVYRLSSIYFRGHLQRRGTDYIIGASVHSSTGTASPISGRGELSHHRPRFMR